MPDKKKDNPFGISTGRKVFPVSKAEKDDLYLSKELEERGR